MFAARENQPRGVRVKVRPEIGRLELWDYNCELAWAIVSWLTCLIFNLLFVQYELALGKFPYPAWKSVFDQLKSVVQGEPPRVPGDSPFSEEFKDFVHLW